MASSLSNVDEQRTQLAILSVREIITVVGSRAVISATSRRNKSRVLDEVLTLASDVQDDIMAAAVAKQSRLDGTPQSRKRKRDVERQRERRVRARLEVHGEDESEHEEPAVDAQQWSSSDAGMARMEAFLKLPTDVQRRALYREFYEATSSARLLDKTCAVCARSQNATDTDVIDVALKDIPNQHRLRPSQSHTSHQLIDGMLLAPEGCQVTGTNTTVSICGSCRRELGKASENPIRLSLANGLWVGDVPWQLQRLTFPEQLLIAHLYPRVFVVKLYPKDRRGHAPETLQSALAGNVTTFAFNMDKIADMIEGRLMPQRPAVLASVLSVTYVGSRKIPKQWLKKTFNVRRFHVGEALRWLKEHNQKYYGDIIIDMDRMHALPEDDIPVEILANMRHEDHVDVVDVENDTYVPPDDEFATQEGSEGANVVLCVAHCLFKSNGQVTRMKTENQL
ncbi:hypothetical protein EVJ58_g8977 [Rhodofomes roseus]|uniref:DUF6570 domain-containing protein n=1 Tax=Rhodofomes roseus TaxID=34475 RepID=A0A4Y9XX20_9APHY|nr:hypothetical protein EVJ58_g8977 [Rhodofomes roseus]